MLLYFFKASRDLHQHAAQVPRRRLLPQDAALSEGAYGFVYQ